MSISDERYSRNVWCTLNCLFIYGANKNIVILKFNKMTPITIDKKISLQQLVDVSQENYHF